MIGRLLLSAFAFAAPLVFYALYVRYLADHDDARPPVLVWLIGAGLAIGTFLAAALLEPSREGRYVPSTLGPNGEIIPDLMIPEGE